MKYISECCMQWLLGLDRNSEIEFLLNFWRFYEIILLLYGSFARKPGWRFTGRFTYWSSGWAPIGRQTARKSSGQQKRKVIKISKLRSQSGSGMQQVHWCNSSTDMNNSFKDWWKQDFRKHFQKWKNHISSKNIKDLKINLNCPNVLSMMSEIHWRRM